jgi:hypothetical protein
MKLSELKKQIKDNIYEILSEGEPITVIASSGTSEEDSIKKNPKIPSDAKAGALTTLKTTKPGTAIVVPTNESEDEDREPTKSELEKEKVKGAPSKFKIPQSDFEDFKAKLKTLVKKIKDMEKGEERTKKMAALKQFIKKPELVKAFKERDVQIDTGDLVG